MATAGSEDALLANLMHSVLTEAQKPMEDNIRRLKDEVASLRSAQKPVDDTIRLLKDEVASLKTAQKPLGDTVRSLKDEVKNLDTTQKPVEDTLKVLKDEVASLETGQKPMKDTMQLLENEITRLKSALQKTDAQNTAEHTNLRKELDANTSDVVALRNQTLEIKTTAGAGNALLEEVKENLLKETKERKTQEEVLDVFMDSQEKTNAQQAELLYKLVKEAGNYHSENIHVSERLDEVEHKLLTQNTSQQENFDTLLTNAKAELRGTKEEMDHLQENFASQTTEQQRKFEEQAAKHTSEIDALKESLGQQQKQMNTLLKEELTKQVSDMAKVYATLSAKMEELLSHENDWEVVKESLENDVGKEIEAEAEKTKDVLKRVDAEVRKAVIEQVAGKFKEEIEQEIEQKLAQQVTEEVDEKGASIRHPASTDPLNSEASSKKRRKCCFCL